MINALNPSFNKTNTPSFKMAYRIDNNWSKSFDDFAEKNFIVDVIEKIKNKDLKLLGKNNFQYHFASNDGDLFYVKDSKGMMSNIKFIPKNLQKEGFYIIDDGRSSNGNLYQRACEFLNNSIKNKNFANNVSTKINRSHPKNYSMSPYYQTHRFESPRYSQKSQTCYYVA